MFKTFSKALMSEFVICPPRSKTSPPEGVTPGGIGPIPAAGSLGGIGAGEVPGVLVGGIAEGAGGIPGDIIIWACWGSK
jgi:hypothetical protein